MAKDRFPSDDDILELTDMVGPGGGKGMDEAGSEVERLLQELDPLPSLEDSPARPASGPAAERLVDPDEKLDMPEMGDIDILLAELGVPLDDGPRPASRQEEPRPALDELPAELSSFMDNAPSTTRPTEESFVSAPEGGAGNGIDLNELDSLLNDMLAPSSGVQSAPVAAALPVQEEAPRSVPGLAAESLEALAGLETVGHAAGGELHSRLAALESDHSSRLSSLEDRLAALCEQPLEPRAGSVGPDELEALKTTVSQQLIAGQKQMSDAMDARLAQAESEKTVLAERLAAAEQALAQATNQLASLPDYVNSLLDARLAAALGPDSPAAAQMAAKSASLILDALDGRGEAIGPEAAAQLRDVLQKSAAAAAARVIREEIGTLLKG